MKYLQRITYLRMFLTGEVEEKAIQLTPFYDFSDFRSFMEGEYEKLGAPEECLYEMSIIRDVDALKDVLDVEVLKCKKYFYYQLKYETDEEQKKRREELDKKARAEFHLDVK